jgi:hypothetical protein
MSGSNHNDRRGFVMATQSYKERMKQERAAATAKRRAEKEAWHRAVALRVECQRMAMGLVKDEIRANGEKYTDYSVKELRQRAEEFIGPWLVAKAQARVEQILRVMSDSKVRMDRTLPVNETHAQNEAAQ